MALSGESRFVLLASSNAHKVQEYANLLSLYGIDVRQSDPRVFKDYAELGETPRMRGFEWFDRLSVFNRFRAGAYNAPTPTPYCDNPRQQEYFPTPSASRCSRTRLLC